MTHSGRSWRTTPCASCYGRCTSFRVPSRQPSEPPAEARPSSTSTGASWGSSGTRASTSSSVASSDSAIFFFSSSQLIISRSLVDITGITLYAPSTLVFRRLSSRASAFSVWGPNLFAANGDEWRRHRRITAPAFSTATSVRLSPPVHSC